MMESFLKSALSAAHAASEDILRYYRGDLEVEEVSLAKVESVLELAGSTASRPSSKLA